MNKPIRILVVLLGLAAGDAQAGMPVFDGSNFAQAVLQVQGWVKQGQQMAQQATSWSQQYTQMAQQIQQLQQSYQQLQQTYQSISGIRNMGDLANNPALRRYLPNDYQQALQLGTGAANGQYSSLSGSVTAMKQASKILDIKDTGLDPNSAAGKAYQNAQNQAALNRVLAEESFKQSGDRITGLQQMLDKVNQAPDDKDIQDLQARIQGEQIMLQNDLIRLSSLSQLQQSQRDIANQQAAEIRMQSTKGEVPRF
jgi:type IV secretion system protein VirB5